MRRQAVHSGGRGIELSAAGREFVDEARGVLWGADGALSRLLDPGALRRGTLRVHASRTIASDWLPRHLMTFRRAHSRIELIVDAGNTAAVVRAVRDGAADIGLIEGAIDHPGLLGRDVARDQLVIVVAPDHPWAARRDPIVPAELATTDWVKREPGSGTRSEFEAALASAGLAPGTLAVVLELHSNEAVRAAVEMGGAAAAVSASVAAPSIEAGLLVPIRFDLPSRAFRSLVHAERPPSPSAQAFLAAIAPDP